MPNSIRIAYICVIVPVIRAERDNFNTLYMKVAVVGATGLVGTRMLQVLAERNFPVTEL